MNHKKCLKMNKITMNITKTLLFACLFLFSALAFGQKHPYLFFTPERLDLLKTRLKSDTAFANNWNGIVREADDLLKKGYSPNKTDVLALTWLMTGDAKYADKIKDILLKLCTMSTWSDTEMLKRNPAWTSDLKTAEKCRDVAIGFDAIYDKLTKNERKTIVDGLVRMGIKPAMDEWILPETRIHTLNSMGHNWWSSIVGVAGIASMAILNDYPEAVKWVETISKAFEEWYLFNGDELHYKVKTFDKDGGMYESVNYAIFGLSEFLLYQLAFTNTFPGKKMTEFPSLEKNIQYFLQVSYPRSGQMYSLDFGDHSPTTACDRPLTLLYTLGYKNPDILWYLNEAKNNIHREGLSAKTPLGIVYQPDMKNIPKEPNLPKSMLFEDNDWAMMRTSWEKNATMLGVKCGYTWNHSHADAGSFILYHKGEAIIKDAGNCGYGSPDYPKYFFQSEAHNVVMFNGKAQPREQQYNGSPLRGQLSNLMDCGNFKYVQANATGPTSANFQRNFRHFVWMGKVLLIIDDVKAYETGKFQWLLHPGGEAKKVGGSININKGKSSVLVRPLFPETLVETGFNHDFPEKMQLTEITAPKSRDPQNPTETYFSIEYPEQVKQTKFITAIILKDSANDRDLPEIEKLQSLTMNGVRIKHHGKVTDLYLNLMADGRLMHLNTCASFEGWETDAYLFGVTYPEGKQADADAVTDYFMAYGSYIRKGEKTIFSSLSKTYLIANQEESKLNMELKGQALINATFNIDQKLSKFILNQKQQIPNLDGNALKIKIESNN
jgi:oligo-alginate lyase